ncbi:MAG: hypothetical protein L3J66_11185 [Bacteroidales bacterium]|nr:hypothetical protein [Bacteroidales bacterium]
MKSFLKTTPATLLVLLAISMPLRAQWDVWSAAAPLSDSVSDNRNAVVQWLEFVENDYYVFWENSTDSLSTSIVYKKFYGDDEPQVLLSQEGMCTNGTESRPGQDCILFLCKAVRNA